mmetsp:Transcript_31961/g.79571  ORF Transcript_31961/g.79571 Transcript_31961/m.79571 type:complete len:172 (-) Transcript_31961:431-946(-)
MRPPPVMRVAPVLHFPLFARPALRRSAVSCSASPTETGTALAPLTSLLAEEELQISLVDTLLDIGVYTLLFGVVALTLYSIFVTLDETNKSQGGWTKRDEAEELKPPSPGAGPARLQKGARYDPATEQWTYPSEEQLAAEAKASGGVVSEANRYERRAEKRQKKKRKTGRR